MKTRLQSARGLVKSGGFRGIYAGLFSAASGSAPSGFNLFVHECDADSNLFRALSTVPSNYNIFFSFLAATFFCSYELTKNVLKPHVSSSMFPFVHMCAATIGEVVSVKYYLGKCFFFLWSLMYLKM